MSPIFCNMTHVARHATSVTHICCDMSQNVTICGEMSRHVTMSPQKCPPDTDMSYDMSLRNMSCCDIYHIAYKNHKSKFLGWCCHVTLPTSKQKGENTVFYLLSVADFLWLCAFSLCQEKGSLTLCFFNWKCEAPKWFQKMRGGW